MTTGRATPASRMPRLVTALALLAFAVSLSGVVVVLTQTPTRPRTTSAANRPGEVPDTWVSATLTAPPAPWDGGEPIAPGTQQDAEPVWAEFDVADPTPEETEDVETLEPSAEAAEDGAGELPEASDVAGTRAIDEMDAFTVTVIRPRHSLTAQELARRLGEDPTDLRPFDWEDDSNVMTLDEEFESYDERVLVDPDVEPGLPPRYLLSQQAGAWIVWEEFGYQGSLQEVLRSLSKDAEIVGFYVDVSAGMQVSFARDGKVVAALDPADLADPLYRGGTGVRALDDYLKDIDVERTQTAERFAPVGVDLVEKVGRVHLDDAWFYGPQLLLTTR